ncbi:MAG: pyruvate dehydrogenase complex E1 component subunit beta [Rhodospirillaceae bacterium]
MAVNILMPALSPTMTEGNLTRWLKSEGERVDAGDVIAEIETDKATMEVEAVDEGVLGKILIDGGTESVPVNTVIAVLLEEGDDPDNAIEVNVASTTRPSGDANEEPAGASNSGPKGDKIASNDALRTSSIGTETVYSGSTTVVSMREALRDAMAEEMRIDDAVFLMGEEVAQYEGAYKVSQGLLAEFGDRRVVDTPITEHGFTGLGVGAAFGGLKPIVEFMTFNFAMQAMDQIINSAAKTNYMSGGQMGCPIVFRGPNGAAARVAAQHSQCYASWYAHIPGLKVIAPSNAADAKGLLKSAIRDLDPVIFLENEILYGESCEVPEDPNWTVPIGKAKVVREGNDVTIIAFSIMVGKALSAAEELSAEGIDAEVIDLRTLRPLDKDTILNSVKKTNRAVVAEEGWSFAGIGSEISAVVMEEAFDYLDAPVERVSAEDVPLPYAANLEALALPQVADIYSAVKTVCYKS